MTAGAAIAADFRREPYIHQLREFELSAELPARALLWQMRTGKSKIVIDTACHNARDNGLDTVLLVAPNGVHANWAQRELPEHHWTTVPHTVLTWDTEVAGRVVERTKAEEQERHERFWAEAKRALAFDGLAWFLFASETVIRDDARSLVRRIMRRRGRVMLILDESDDYGKPGSIKSKMMHAVSRRCHMRRILTGTPTEDSPLRAYSQFEMLEKGALGFTRYADFKREFAVYETRETRGGRSYPALVDYVNLGLLKERMARLSSVVLRSDCQDLPDIVPVTRLVQATREQLRVHWDLVNGFLTEIGDEELSVGENTAKLIKLQQVMSGYLVDEYGDRHVLEGGNPRLDALVEEVLMTGGRNVVWCAFRPDMDAVTDALRGMGREVITYHGRTPEAEKARARVEFAPGGSGADDLVGHPASGGRGLNLSGADKIIFYSHVLSAKLRQQAIERATEMHGQNVTAVDLVVPGTDEYVLELTREKTERADDVSRHGLREVLEGLLNNSGTSRPG